MNTCNQCHAEFKSKGDYSTCWKCLPKCDCGKLVKPPFKKCYTCNQDTKKDLCTECKLPFDGKGKYKKCYKCNKTTFETRTNTPRDTEEDTYT
jgi:hypothetical protein